MLDLFIDENDFFVTFSNDSSSCLPDIGPYISATFQPLHHFAQHHLLTVLLSQNWLLPNFIVAKTKLSSVTLVAKTTMHSNGVMERPKSNGTIYHEHDDRQSGNNSTTNNSHSRPPVTIQSDITYEPSTILITGGAGFIGSHVVDLLLAKYPHYRIIVLDKLDYCAALDNINHHVTNPSCTSLKWCRGDIRSKCLVDYLLRNENIDTIMHFAASTHVDNSFHSSITFTSNNVVGTHVLLESAREYGKIKRFIHVSTDEVYGGETDLEKEDGSVLAPTNPYACTKAAAELICRGYAKSFNMPIIITRGNNVYGPRQYPDKLIAKSFCLLFKQRKAFIHGNGLHLRSYVYVTDIAKAFDIILHHGNVGSVYNIGTDEELTNLHVVKRCVKTSQQIINKTELNSQDNIDIDDDENDDAINYEKYIEFVQDRDVNDQHYSIDSTKLKQLGWKCEVSWREGIKRTAQWYSNDENLKRWPDFHRGLVAHPSLEGITKEELLM